MTRSTRAWSSGPTGSCSFLPGRRFSSPADFNTQLDEWLVRANSRTVRAIDGRPVDLLDTDYRSMLPLPPIAPPIGLNHRIRLARDYYVRIDTVDYSVDPRVIGRFVDVAASLDEVIVYCEGRVVARHRRSWAKRGVITDPAHVATAAVASALHRRTAPPLRCRSASPRWTSGRAACAAGLRRPVRRRRFHHPTNENENGAHTLVTAATKAKPTPPAHNPPDGLPSMLAYLAAEC